MSINSAGTSPLGSPENYCEAVAGAAEADDDGDSNACGSMHSRTRRGSSARRGGGGRARRRSAATHPAQTEAADEEAVKLLDSVFPPGVAQRLRAGGLVDLADAYDEVSVFFCDVSSFTNWCDFTGSPTKVVEALSTLFNIIDELAEEHDVYKVETVGDQYLGICGAPMADDEHAVKMARFALDVAAINSIMELIFPRVAETPEKEMPPLLQLRIGCHLGPIVAGVIGAERPRWQIFGDAVNVASRMESTGQPGRVQVSASFASKLREAAPGAFSMSKRGEVPVKGRGLVRTCWLHEEMLLPEDDEGKANGMAVSGSGSQSGGQSSSDAEMLQRVLAIVPRQAGTSDDDGNSIGGAAASPRIMARRSLSLRRRSSRRMSISIVSPLLSAGTDVGGSFTVVGGNTPDSVAAAGGSPAGAASRRSSILSMHQCDDGESRRRVLLVHNKLNVALQLARILRRNGFAVCVAGGLQEARDGVAALQPPAVVCATDWPVGVAFAKECLAVQRQHGAAAMAAAQVDSEEALPRMSVLLSTAGVGEMENERWKQLGAHGVLNLGAPQREIVRAVRRACRTSWSRRRMSRAEPHSPLAPLG